MFDFYYNGILYKAKYWIEASPNNFLIMAEDLNKNIKFIYSQNVKSLPTTSAFLRSTSVDISKNEIYNIRKTEKEEFDLIDYQNVNLEKIDFMSLLYIYRRINYIHSGRVEDFKDRIEKQLRRRIYEYEEEGRFDYSEDVVDILNFSFTIDFYNDEKEAIKDLIKEFAVFIRIKIYSKLNLYDLLCEREKFRQILKGRKTLGEIGFSNISEKILSDRFVPALEVLIRLKEDLIMTEIFSITRKALLLNPYTVTSAEFERAEKDDFKYDEEARFRYSYMYYENLGIDTDAAEAEISSYNRWEYEKICTHLYSLAEELFKDRDICESVLKEAKRHIDAGESFLSYFMEFLNKTLKL